MFYLGLVFKLNKVVKTIMGYGPKSCMNCPYDYRCNASMGTPGCHFYPVGQEKVSFVTRLKHLFGKIFN